MNNNQTELSLREVLKVAECVKYYRAGVKLDENEFWQDYNIDDVKYAVEVMEVDLERLVQIMVDLEVQQRKTGLMEYFEERMGIETQIKHIKLLETVVSKSLVVLDQQHPPDIARLMEKLAIISERLLQVNEHLNRYKHRLEVSIIYHEICYNIISSLNQEISDCLAIEEKLSNSKLSSPRRHLQSLELDQIVSRMKINDLSYTNNMSMKSMKLPTFDEQDEEIYIDYTSLESRTKPLSISLDIVPLKIGEFNMICGDQFPYASESIQEKYDMVIAQWSLLQTKLKKLKRETIDTKWNDIFIHLIKEIKCKCQEVIESSSGITDEIGEKLRLCTNSVTLINKAFSDKIIYENDILNLYNNELLPVWEQVSNLLSHTTTNSENSFNDNDHNSFKLSKGNQPYEAKTNTFGNGLGIDLGIGVESINVPFSIEKKDKIKLWRNSQLMHDKKDIKHKLIAFQEKHCEDDEITLVNKTPRLNISSLKLDDQRGSSQRNIDELWYILSRENSRIPSKIPLISSDYQSMELPIIKKKFYKHIPPSKIPEISPDHPVFNSPDRLHQDRIGPLELMTKRPMLKFPTRQPISSRNYAIMTRLNGSPVNLKDSSLYMRPTSSLNVFTTPDLKFT